MTNSQPALIDQLFTAQATRTPKAIALTDNKRCWSYDQLHTRTNQLAHFLQTQGVGPEKIVGCWLHSSFDTVVWVLAICKAGGAYLLLDPHLPSERLRAMAQDAQPSFVIADAHPANVLHDLGPVVYAHDAEALATTLAPTPPVNLAGPDNLAYIAYTSGSTGRPKGVLITHRAVANHATAFKTLFRLGVGDRSPLMAPLAFDMATEEMFPPLIAGCTLIDAPLSAPTMKEFTQSVKQHRYTMLNIPAPLWHQWTAYLAETNTPIPAYLRLLIAGSDCIYTQMFRQWQSLAGADRVQWAAAYGVTEATVTTLCYLTAHQDDLSNEPVMPIGRPLANMSAYIVTDKNRLAKAGETGEICIGGAGVARGYHHLPQATKARFVRDPFSKQPGARMYRTGDVGRLRPDGNLVWLGRKDHQIKIQGLRIEPAEVEAAICDHPLVKAAVVMFVPASTPTKPGTLVAFVQTADTPLDISRLRAFLRRRLHRHMIPKKIIQLDNIPLNRNGKIDRKALQLANVTL